MRVTEDAMNVGKRDEARKTVDITESSGFTHPRIVPSFSRRRKCIPAYETRHFPPLKSVKLPTRFHEEPSLFFQAATRAPKALTPDDRGFPRFFRCSVAQSRRNHDFYPSGPLHGGFIAM
jgi:hypothetical protein